MGTKLEQVQRFYELFGTGDLDGARELFDPEVETVTPVDTIRGWDAFREYGQVFKTALPDSGMSIVQAIESSDTVAVEGRYTGTHTGPMASPQGEIPATGRSLDLPFAELFRFDGDLIASHHVYLDQITFLTQLGLMPRPASAGS